MQDIIGIVGALNSLSPLGLAAGLGYVIYLLVRGKQHVQGEIHQIRTNDLHELGDMAETLRRIEVKISEEFSYIRAKLNGKP